MKSGWQILISALWHKPVATLDKAAGSMRQWFDSSLGEAVLRREMPLIQSMRDEHAAQAKVGLTVTAARHGLFSKTKDMVLDIRIFPGLRTLRVEPDSPESALVCQLEEIPLPDNSVDFVLLHHALEFSENPHDVLREAIRVLAPHGHLLLVGFNPWSLFGLRASVEGMFRLAVPWAHHRLSARRLTDWLYLMSCEPAGVARGFYTMPVQNRLLRRVFGLLEPLAARLGLPGGGFFMIHATKNVFGRLQGKRQRNYRPQLVPFPVATPAAKVVHLVRKSDS